MIFVNIAYENLSGHTAPFLGMQIVLLMVAIMNVLYVLDANISYEFLGGLRNTKLICITYIICNVAISFVKIAATVFAVKHEVGVHWTSVDIGSGPVSGKIIDLIWMLFNSLIPLIVSFFRMRWEYGISVTIEMRKQKYLDDDVLSNRKDTAQLLSDSGAKL